MLTAAAAPLLGDPTAFPTSLALSRHAMPTSAWSSDRRSRLSRGCDISINVALGSLKIIAFCSCHDFVVCWPHSTFFEHLEVFTNKLAWTVCNHGEARPPHSMA